MRGHLQLAWWPIRRVGRRGRRTQSAPNNPRVARTLPLSMSLPTIDAGRPRRYGKKVQAASRHDQTLRLTVISTQQAAILDPQAARRSFAELTFQRHDIEYDQP